MNKTVFTHVSAKALKGIRRVAELSKSNVYLHPVPYGKDHDKFTVVVTKNK